MSAELRRMLQVDEAAKVAGVSVSTLNKLRLTGGGPMFAKIGKRVVYDPSDLGTWLDSRKRSSTSDAGRAA